MSTDPICQTLRHDENLDGTLQGTETTSLSDTMTDFTFAISNVGGLPDTGDALSVQIVVSADGGNEEFVFDHIRIQGTAVPVELQTFTIE